MARYELILRLDGALWLRIIFKFLLTPKRVIKMIPVRTPNNVLSILMANSRIFFTFFADCWSFHGPF